MRTLEDTTFLLLMVAISLAFAWIIWPLYGAILWASVTAIVFAPLHRKLSQSIGPRQNLAAFATALIIVAMVILPLTLIGASLLQEASSLYVKIQSGELNLVRLFRQVLDGLPVWAADIVRRFGLTSLGAAQETLSASLLKSSQFLTGQAVSIGQSTFDFIVNLFVMLYLLFFLLRDGDALSERIKAAIPLSTAQKNALFRKFAIVIRASVKGDMFVALLQGVLGGLIFWFLGVTSPLLWAVLMAFLSLLPVVGAGFVWFPVSIYFLATGAVWQGVVLIAYGALVIGLVDNILRPVLVGNDTKMPEYVVLISTLGGIAVFGFNGLVVGPMIAAMFIAAWDIFCAARQEVHNERDSR
jgi:predicted PurR-regulated permease PerM